MIQRFKLKIDRLESFWKGSGLACINRMENQNVKAGTLFEILPSPRGTYMYCPKFDGHIYAMGNSLDRLSVEEKKWLDTYFEPVVIDYNQYWAKLNEI